MKALCLFLMLASASAYAVPCTTNLTLNSFLDTNNNTTRQYYDYVPSTTPTVLWVMLHGTQPGTATALPCPFQRAAMQTLANAHGILVLWPISTFVGPPNNSWFWDAYSLCSIWGLTCPLDNDDSGFIAQLITYYKSNYTQITKVYVAGMSSGAFMAHRVGVDSTDVTAVGAASGQIYALITTNSMPRSRPIPVLMLNGDMDTTVPICGQTGRGWGSSSFPSSDTSIGYWSTMANGCNQTL